MFRFRSHFRSIPALTMALALVCAGAPAFADDEFVRAGEALAAGDTTSALAGFDRVARAGGELAEAAHFEQVRLMADQGGAQTVEEAREFLGRYPDSVYTDTVRGFLADALIAANRGADAFAVIDTRLTDRPEDSPDIWTLRRARALASAGRIHEALADAYLVTHEGFKSPVVADARKLADELRAKGASARTPTRSWARGSPASARGAPSSGSTTSTRGACSWA